MIITFFLAIFRCSGCKIVWYHRDCQHADWKAHKLICVKPVTDVKTGPSKFLKDDVRRPENSPETRDDEPDKLTNNRRLNDFVSADHQISLDAENNVRDPHVSQRRGTDTSGRMDITEMASFLEAAGVSAAAVNILQEAIFRTLHFMLHIIVCADSDLEASANVSTKLAHVIDRLPSAFCSPRSVTTGACL